MDQAYLRIERISGWADEPGLRLIPGSHRQRQEGLMITTSEPRARNCSFQRELGAYIRTHPDAFTGLRLHTSTSLPGTIQVHCIGAGRRGAGQGRFLLALVCSIADATQVDLVLQPLFEPDPTATGPQAIASQADLEAWYARYGFVHDGLLWMRRKPAGCSAPVSHRLSLEKA